MNGLSLCNQIIVGCKKPPEVAFAEVSNTRQIYAVGQSAVYDCVDGYKASGPIFNGVLSYDS